MPLVRPFIVTGLIGLAAATSLFSPLAQAQQVYRIVGPDGRVTFSDKPPLDATAKVAPTVALPSGGASSGPVLPFELRQASSKFPVTLYTGRDCAPCGAGRAYLSSRGVPFAEKTISTPADAEALQRMAGVNSLPLLTIGGQQLKGYSNSEWGQFLDAAGYPAKSALPATWRNPAPSPLVAVEPAIIPAPASAETAAAPAPVRRPSPQAAPAADNPAGIRF